VIGLVVDGLSNREIGKSLGVQEQTVKNHVARIMDKLNVRNRVELALKAVRDNIA
jgi:two-component system NarL family response regulator